MIRLYSLALCFCVLAMLATPVMAVDCAPDNITLASQADVDNFQVDHGPGCDRVVQILTISGPDIENLDGLSGLTSVYWLSVTGNPLLTDTSGLSSIVSTTGPMEFTDNASLVDLNGLSGVAVLTGGALILSYNPKLVDLSGLSGLLSIGASLAINNNAALQNLDAFSNLTHVASNINIGYNNNLTSIAGLSGITGFSATFDLRSNSQLVTLPSTSGWTNLRGLILYYNTALTDLDGLAGVETIGNNYSEVWIKNNTSLTNLDGLADLVSINAGLDVSGNDALSDCSALIRVLDQTDDALPGPGPGAAGIPDIAEDLIIQNNQTGCDSLEEVIGTGPSPGFELIPQLGGLYTDVGVRSLVNPDKSCDWSPGETVEIWWNKPDGKLAEFTVDANGCFAAMFKLDEGEKIPGSLPGEHLVQARGSVSGTSTQPFEQVDKQLHISPPQGAPGREVIASGCNWDVSSSVEITWLEDGTVLDTLEADGSGCINHVIRLPREKDGIYGLHADSGGQGTGAAYRVISPTLVLTPPEGPADTKIPVMGCDWFPEEVIEYKFTLDNLVIDTGGTGAAGCLTTNSPVEPTLYIPAGTAPGARILQATGLTSGLRVKVPFTVVERSLEFDPPNGQPGDPVAVSGCGWVGNSVVLLEWGYPDTNNHPIQWLADVDTGTGCFGKSGVFNINVPANSITGPLTQTASGDELGETTAEFIVNHGGTIEFPNRDGVVGHSMTINVHDAIVGEAITFYWGAFYDTPLGSAGATSSDFSFDVTLPTRATLGNEWITARGSKGFSGQRGVNIIDDSTISVVSNGDIPVGSIVQLEGRNWSATSSVALELWQGPDSWYVGRIPVPEGSIDFSVGMPLPVDVPPGSYTLKAENSFGYRSETGITLVPGPLPAFGLAAAYADTAPALDGFLANGEWDYGQKAEFSNGFITARSDDTRLYILLDVLNDTFKDALGNDGFWLSFDIWGNQAIDADWDLNFRLDGGDLVLDAYTGPNSFSARNSTNLRSAYAAGFNCFTVDNSAEADFTVIPPVLRCDKHRVYEIGIELQSIDALPGELVRLGVRTRSQSPQFTEDSPPNFHSDFHDLGSIRLAASKLATVPPSGTVTGIGANGFEIEVTQATQDGDNSLKLVADKETAVRVHPQVASDALVRTYLFGRRNGLDLPGSPLVALATVPPSPDRNEMSNTANFLLPPSWTSEGTIELMAMSENADGQNTRIHVETFIFTVRDVPDYWIVPVNSGSVASPTLVADSAISTQQSYLETVFPLNEINWVRRDWSDLGAMPLGSKKAKDWLPDVNDQLNDFYDDLVISHSTALQASGHEPFTLPDQVYGFTAVGGGLADAAWAGGSGRVGSGFYGTSGDLTMAHEINHNLDMSTSGTWGKHTTDADDDTDNPDWGCSAGGGNTDWPRTDDEIGETGFDTRLPWQASGTAQVTVVPDNFPDYMSYCRSSGESNAVSGQLPFKWTSAYRWSKQFTDFTPPASAGAIVPPGQVYYVSGVLQLAGTGTLDPVKTQPGVPTPVITPGDYSLEIQNAVGSVLYSTTFHASFKSIEGDELEQVYFHFRLPYQETGGRIVLKHLGAELATIEASANAPTIEVLLPAGGETWDGEAEIQWIADDLDGDDLSFSILYSPDGGDSWFPVARNLTGTEYFLDSSHLPGGAGGRIRLIVTDGFHTVTADSSGSFSVTAPTPTVIIESPLDGQLFKPADWVHLRGSASLPAGPAEGLEYAWFLNGEMLDTVQDSQAMLDEGDYILSLLAYDYEGNYGESSVSIMVRENDPPNEPILPLPVDGASNTPLDSVLTWLGGDTDGDPVTYDVYLESGNTDPAILVCDDAVLSQCSPPSGLAPLSTYYWKVVATDDRGLESTGPVWSFTTARYDSVELIFSDSFE